MKVIYFGTPLFAAHVLDYLLQNTISVVAVVSKPDRPKGRSGNPIPTPVKEAVLKANLAIPIFQPEVVSDPTFADLLKAYEADLFVVVAYGEILKQHILDIPKLGCINLHASLLPKYRGAAPIQRCIIEGETESGVSIMHMVKKMDAGDVIKEVSVSIGENTTFSELESLLCETGKKALLEVVQDFGKGTPVSCSQNHDLATFAPKIELEDCEIEWNLSAMTLHNLARGVNPYPGAWCYVLVKGEHRRLKIIKTAINKSILHQSHPGTILNQDAKGNLLIATGDGALELLEVQLEGKKAMTSDELTRGISRQSFSFIL